MNNVFNNRELDSDSILVIVSEIEQAHRDNKDLNQEMFFDFQIQYEESSGGFKVATTVYDILSESVYDNLADTELNEKYLELNSFDLYNLFDNILEQYFSDLKKLEEHSGVQVLKFFQKQFTSLIEQTTFCHPDCRLGIDLKFCEGLYQMGYWFGLDGKDGITILMENQISHSFEVESFEESEEILDSTNEQFEKNPED